MAALTTPANRTEIATIGGGCFWCTEAVFQELHGVAAVMPGYAGGTVADPTYEDVCGGGTGHAEVVQVTFDPSILPYSDVLEIFFATHDPTTLNRQGGDAGTQYRSIVLYSSPEQRATAEAAIRERNAEEKFGRRVVTQLVPLEKFYPAEEYHRNYFRRNPDRGYCQMVISPKMKKFRKSYTQRLATAP
ncbi:MAG: peptide-methionine (S)-S-oxide reductase MsrA [Thermoplasmata archaeon]|nr:peptide-methionine (S)-S-oxide reductase MsrA [Thermoplasmata archaeon]